MDITEKDVKEFQALYKKKFNKDVDATMARKQLTMLVRQMEIVYQPVTTEQIEDLARREATKEDATALAELIYDVYKDKESAKA